MLTVPVITQELVSKRHYERGQAYAAQRQQDASSTWQAFYKLPTDPAALKRIHQAFAQRLISKKDQRADFETIEVLIIVEAIFSTPTNSSVFSTKDFAQEKAVDFLIACVAANQLARDGLRNHAVIWEQAEVSTQHIDFSPSIDSASMLDSQKKLYHPFAAKLGGAVIAQLNAFPPCPVSPLPTIPIQAAPVPSPTVFVAPSSKNKGTVMVQTITADVIQEATFSVLIKDFYLLPEDPAALRKIHRAFAERLSKQCLSSDPAEAEAEVIRRLTLAIFDDYENHSRSTDSSGNRFNQEKAVQFLMACVGTDQIARGGLRNCATVWSNQDQGLLVNRWIVKPLGDAIIERLSSASVKEKSYKGVAIISFIATAVLAVLGVLMLLNPVGWGTALTGGGLTISTMFIAGSACIGIGGIGALGSGAVMVSLNKKKISLEIVD